MIDWRKVADENNLTTKQFERQIIEAIAIIGTMKIDERECKTDTLTFTVADSTSDIEIIIRRV
jgi:hypothetical protein